MRLRIHKKIAGLGGLFANNNPLSLSNKLVEEAIDGNESGDYIHTFKPWK